MSDFKFDTNTVIYILYILYKTNMLTRGHLKQIFQVIKNKAPDDIMKFLVGEVEKL